MLYMSGKYKLPVSIIAACMLFTSLFIQPVFFNFWAQMAVSIVLLCIMAFGLDRHGMSRILMRPGNGICRTLFLGVLSSLVLYGIFYGGHIIAGKIFKHASADIADIYNLKTGHDTWFIIGLIVMIIGPGEELFWRGYIQRNLMKEKGAEGIILSAIIYGLVHTASGNIMLISAALICGLFWGYLFWRWHNIYINIISHILWDILVFIILPFQ